MGEQACVPWARRNRFPAAAVLLEEARRGQWDGTRASGSVQQEESS